MNRLLAVVALGAVTLGFSTTAAEAHAPSLDSVTGEALLSYTPNFSAMLVRIDARSGRSGEDPAGNVSINICPLFLGPCGTAFPELGGRVTCLRVQGNRAIIGYYGGITALSDRIRGLVEVIDNGSSGAPPDVFTVVSLPVREVPVTPAQPPNPDDVPITNCPATLPSQLPPGGFIRFSGPLPPPLRPDVLQDLTVIDAPALPTSKDQCKNGGWQTYGVFKNQGDCVSFVATSGKNPPANSP